MRHTITFFTCIRLFPYSLINLLISKYTFNMTGKEYKQIKL